MNKPMKIVQLNAATLPVYRSELASLLMDAIEQGAPMGFLPSLSSQMAENVFHDLRPQMTQQRVMLWIARDSNGVLGTVQLQIDDIAVRTQSGTVNALLVHPFARRSGVATKLMHKLEETAIKLRCVMLSSGLQSGSEAESFYRSQGYRCRSIEEEHAHSYHHGSRQNVLYYKLLR